LRSHELLLTRPGKVHAGILFYLTTVTSSNFYISLAQTCERRCCKDGESEFYFRCFTQYPQGSITTAGSCKKLRCVGRFVVSDVWE